MVDEKINNGWDSSPYDTEWKSDEEIVKMLPNVYKLLDQVIDSYIDIDTEQKKILIAWIMAAPYYREYYAFPYLFINASKSSGKTRLLKLINAIVPNSVMTVSLSQSALFRVKEVKDCILIDEAERLHGREKENLIDLLNSGYKKGGKVMRVEGDKVKKVREFDVYGPIALANIWGLDSVLEDRCITIILQKTEKSSVIRAPEMFDLDPRVKALSAYFSASSVYVGTFVKGVYQAYANSFFESIYIHTLPTLPTSTYTSFDSKIFKTASAGLQVDGREFELWLPLFSIFFVVDSASVEQPTLNSYPMFMELLDIINRKAATRKGEETDLDRDTEIAVALHEYLSGKSATFALTTKDFIMFTGIKEDWLTPEWVARFFKRCGIIKARRRLGKGNEYEINTVTLKRYLEARDIIFEQQSGPKQKQSGQQDITISVTAQDTPMKVKLPPPKLVNTKGAEVICPVCGKKTGALYDYGGNWMCTDCLNDKQRTTIE